MHYLTVDLRISSDEYIKMYQTPGIAVMTHSRDGRSIRFPAKILQSFVTREGVAGTFRIGFDREMKFQSIDRL